MKGWGDPFVKSFKVKKGRQEPIKRVVVGLASWPDPLRARIEDQNLIMLSEAIE